MFGLLLPALIPSWRFFDFIGPSPRIEFALLTDADERITAWQEFRPRPQRLAPVQMALRLLWNPQWNENLFLTSCVEKLIDDPSARAMDELLSRVAGTIDLGDNCEGAISELYLKVRALVIKRVNGAIIQEIVFISEPYRLDCLRVGDTR